MEVVPLWRAYERQTAGHGRCSSESRSPRGDVGADDRSIVARGFNGLFGVLVGDKPCVVIESKISFSPKAIEDGQQGGVFPVNALACKFDDSDVMARHTSRAKAVAEHQAKRTFPHRFISLLQAGFLIEGEDFPSRNKFLSALARKRSICAQSVACGSSFFMRTSQRNAFIVPNVFKEGILSSAAGVQLFSRQNRIAHFASELVLDFAHRFGQRFARRSSDHEHIDVAGGMLLLAGERAV
jgi:hypothetical protein